MGNTYDIIHEWYKNDSNLDDGVFIVNLTYENNQYKADKTFDEIMTEHEKGKIIGFQYNGYIEFGEPFEIEFEGNIIKEIEVSFIEIVQMAESRGLMKFIHVMYDEDNFLVVEERIYATGQSVTPTD